MLSGRIGCYGCKSMQTLDDILNLLEPIQFDAHWRQIDKIIGRLPSDRDQIDAWGRIVNRLSPAPISKGHPYFRLAILHLLTDSEEAQAISYLELAYQEDRRYGPSVGLTPHRMAAYRLLSLTKGFLTHLRSKKNWQKEQLVEPYRPVLTRMLLTVYDKSLIHVLDREGYTDQEFSRLISHRGLLRFASENYFCAEDLLELFFVQNSGIDKLRNEYPLARAIVGLLGGVLEAILADRLPNARGEPLGRLIEQGHEQGVIQVGTRLAALSSLMLYLRNHIHADRDASQIEYFIDINVAKGCKVALDWVISELLQLSENRKDRKSVV